MKLNGEQTIVRCIRGVALLAFLCAVLLPARADAPVGMACHVQGKPQVKTDGAWKPLRLLQKLSSGDAVRCGAGQSAVLVLFGSGARYQVGAGSTATVGSTAVSGAKMLGGGRAASTRVAQTLGGARTGAVMFRPPPAFKRLHTQPDELPAPKAPPAHDWLREDERSWTMIPISGAASYIFTLVEPRDYVLWSTPIAAGDGGPLVALPDALKLQPRRPYVWRLHGFREDGKFIKSHWGITTMLPATEAAQLIEDEKALLEENGTLPDDEVQLALLAEAYRKYGVLQNALELLENPKLSEQPGLDETRAELIESAGPYAQMLATQKTDE